MSPLAQGFRSCPIQETSRNLYWKLKHPDASGQLDKGNEYLSGFQQHFVIASPVRPDNYRDSCPNSFRDLIIEAETIPTLRDSLTKYTTNRSLVSLYAFQFSIAFTTSHEKIDLEKSKM